MSIPTIVENEVHEAVRTAIQFGVSARDFKGLVAEAWGMALREKIKFDAAELSK